MKSTDNTKKKKEHTTWEKYPDNRKKSDMRKVSRCTKCDIKYLEKADLHINR